ncbi:MAG: hypothetical protein HC877_19345 [Thioploca sp.]|nr:hypothetical protein [Thioploca sp.]
MLSQFTIKQLEQRLTQLLETCQVINAAVVATLDGHLCTMKQRQQQYPLERLATMGVPSWRSVIPLLLNYIWVTVIT